MLKRLTWLIMLAFLLLAAVTVTLAQADRPVVTLVTYGSLGDVYFNDLLFAGLSRAALEHDFELRTVCSGMERPCDEVGTTRPPTEESSQQAYQALFEAAATSDVVVLMEFTLLFALPDLTVQFPDVTFVHLMNLPLELPTVVNGVIPGHEPAYLAGVLAALTTTQTSLPQINADKVVGVIGRVEQPFVDAYLYGFLQGACAVDPEITVLHAYEQSPYSTAEVGQTLAQPMLDAGADVIFAATTSESSAGIIDLAEDQGAFAIALDTYQDHLAPGSVLTSYTKQIDDLVYDLVTRVLAGEVLGGQTVAYSMSDGAWDNSDMIFTRHLLPDEVMTAYAEAEEGIMQGMTQVVDASMLPPDVYGLLKADFSCATVGAINEALGADA